MSLSRWAALLAYPSKDYHASARACLEAVPSAEMEEFLRTIDGLPVEALQELFTQTFDWNPETTLDIGWHLFGENYDRGDFLVQLRSALRAHEVPESQELPDHFSHVLQLIDRMPEEERTDLVRKHALPAIGKLREGLAKAESPFLPLVVALNKEIAELVPETIPAGEKS
ncbi:MAG: molecular chaperone TorD family protein [Bryobacterales bacterium]|nr:molecular chaperone TorD family protein [Bryobacterales bacterium]